MLRGTVDRVRFRGASLEGNALGDPAERELIVYLPPSYDRDVQSSALAPDRVRRFPVVMVLAGFAATNSSLLSFKPWEPNLLERYERLLEQGCGEAILVLPDCFTQLGGSQYLDSPAQGSYQRYLADDIIPWIDKHYCTLPRRGARAIVGKSSGGFGALRMGMDRPECFAVIGSHAGDCAFELSIRPRFAEAASVYERHGGAARFLQHLFAQSTAAESRSAAAETKAAAPARTRPGPAGQAEFHALELLALAHAYAPRVEPSSSAALHSRGSTHEITSNTEQVASGRHAVSNAVRVEARPEAREPSVEARPEAREPSVEARPEAREPRVEQRPQVREPRSETSQLAGELPFDAYTAQIVPEKWARWLAHDPLVRSLDGLKEARLVFLDAGKSDEYGLQFGARSLAKRCVDAGVAVEHEEFDGGHMGTAYRYDVSLPKLIAALS